MKVRYSAHGKFRMIRFDNKIAGIHGKMLYAGYVLDENVIKCYFSSS